MDLQAARTQLEQMLSEIDTATVTLENENAGQTSELSHVHQHPGDVGTDVADADRETALIERADTHRAEIVAALGRIEDGSYGTCVVCGQPIGDARLEIRPEALRCLKDQAAYEAAPS